MMARQLIFATSVMLAPAVANAHAAPKTSLVAFADAFDHAQIMKDRSALVEMVSDDLVFIDGTGSRLGKSAFIDGWTSVDDKYDPIILEDRTVTMLGPDVGIVGATTSLSGTSNGKPFSTRFRFADTFQKIRGRWRAVHIQVTRIKP